MATVCELCLKDIRKWNLDFSAEIICDDCMRRLVMGHRMNGKWWEIKPKLYSKRRVK